MSQIVKNYYDDGAEQEWERLSDPYNQVEWMSTLRLMDRYLPDAGHICDIGSGPGRYAMELLQQGYRVTLFDLSANELNIARKNIEELGLQAEAYICEDARNLRVLGAEAYDGALVLGPLYHVLEEAERLEMVKQVHRILKPEGTAIFSYINSWGCLKAGVTEFSETFRDPERIYDYLQEQRFDELRGFTEAYFSVPHRALEEVKRGGFEVISCAGAESFLAGMRTEVTRLYREDRQVYENLVQAASEMSEAPQYREATEHFLIAARKSSI
ncbi:class I SAM-dependent methyltransferase [Paenibacillus sp. M1]|uniref:Class I SAM-dependent methyltransferase n=1 Tax=Paenibacillus haidiansis TaxID=1574488 RepID=A0ABU7VQZ0_9BACL